MKILKVILKEETLADDVDLDEIATRSAQFSGSDLHELCRCAAMNSYIESVRSSQKQAQQDASSASANGECSSSSSSLAAAKTPGSNVSEERGQVIRKVDFEVAFEKMAAKMVALNTNIRERYELNM